MDNISELNSVRFLPWVGKNYHERRFFGKKILVLGESFHCDKCTREECENDFSECRDLAERTVRTFLNKPEGHIEWMNTYTKFERSLIGEWTDEEHRKEIWNSIAFYNYLQYSLDSSRKPGDSDAYEKAIKPFYEVIDYIKPEAIIVWGERLWWYLPGDERWEECEEIIMDDGFKVKNGYYKLSNGNKTKVFPVTHPSYGYIWDYWHQVIKKMLQN